MVQGREQNIQLVYHLGWKDSKYFLFIKTKQKNILFGGTLSVVSGWTKINNFELKWFLCNFRIQILAYLKNEGELGSYRTFNDTTQKFPFLCDDHFCFRREQFLCEWTQKCLLFLDKRQFDGSLFSQFKKYLICKNNR